MDERKLQKGWSDVAACIAEAHEGVVAESVNKLVGDILIVGDVVGIVNTEAAPDNSIVADLVEKIADYLSWIL